MHPVRYILGDLYQSFYGAAEIFLCGFRVNGADAESLMFVKLCCEDQRVAALCDCSGNCLVDLILSITEKRVLLRRW